MFSRQNAKFPVKNPREIFLSKIFLRIFLPSSIVVADFKKASQEEKTKSFPTLLKGYQEEVDNLTKRAKFGENAFLNIYQKLYEAPDPAPALSSATVSILFSTQVYNILSFVFSSQRASSC